MAKKLPGRTPQTLEAFPHQICQDAHQQIEYQHPHQQQHHPGGPAHGGEGGQHQQGRPHHGQDAEPFGAGQVRPRGSGLGGGPGLAEPAAVRKKAP